MMRSISSSLGLLCTFFAAIGAIRRLPHTRSDQFPTSTRDQPVNKMNSAKLFRESNVNSSDRLNTPSRIPCHYDALESESGYSNKGIDEEHLSKMSQRRSLEAGTPYTSSEPTGSPGPTSTITPTRLPDKFDWYLERVGPVAAFFTEESQKDEIKLTYSISHRNNTVKVLDIKCKDPVAASVVSVSQSTRIASPTRSALSVFLDIDEKNVSTSTVWKDGNATGEGLIELCVRVDLVLGDDIPTSVNFHEQKLYISIGLTQGFSISQIDLERDAADVSNEEAVVDFGITSCQCSIARQCVNDVLVQGEDVFICVFAPSDGDVEISTIGKLDFLQGMLAIHAVQNSTPDALTEVSLYGKSAVIRSQLRSELFDSVNPGNLIAVGEVSVRFGSVPSRSLLILPRTTHQHRSVRVSRSTQEQRQRQQAEFFVNVQLASLAVTTGNDNGSDMKDALIGGSLGGLAVAAFLIYILILAHRRRKSIIEQSKTSITCQEQCS